MSWIWVGFAVFIGGLLAVQPALNAEIGRHLGGPVVAAAVNFTVGLIALVAIVIAFGGVVPNVSAAVRTAPWWSWFGGLIGATFVASAALLAPRIGTAALFSSIMLGQLTASLIIDKFGLFNLATRDVDWQRVFGVGLVAAGVILVTRG